MSDAVRSDEDQGAESAPVAGGPPSAGPVGGGTGDAGPDATVALPGHLSTFAAAPTVRRWLERSGDGAEPSARVGDLEMLQRFCTSIDTDPDELIAQCLRSTKSGSTAISAVGRRKTDQAITDFVASEGATGRDAIVLANKLRAFLIHNGIFMQGAAAID